MALTQGERSLHIVQVGRETTHGTAVPATVRLPGFSTGITTLDRAPSKVNEDFGSLALNQAGRGYYGVRLAKLPYKGNLNFEDCIRYLGAFIEGGITTPTTVTTGVYSWAYLSDTTADSLDSLTIEEGDNINAYQMPFALGESLKLSFNALASPGSSPWQVEASFIGRDKIPHAFTSAVSVPAGVETAMGHLTRAYLGTTATAFASLSEQVGLLAFDLTIPTGVLARKYGGSTDTFDTYGRAKYDPTGTITFYSTAATQTALFTPYQSFSGSPVMSEFHLRVQATGSLIATGYNKLFTIDSRVRLSAVPVAEDANGATVYQGNIELVNDATLGGPLMITVQNGVAS
jgi:hypothetical protein